ncbi:sulfotransferase family protein [Porticoccus sp.]
MVAQIDNKFIKLSIKKSYARFLSYVLYEGRPLTTRGRWINALVFFLYRLQLFSPFVRKVTEPIFILGTGRSGTTILGVTLAMHPAVGFLNEPKALWSYLHSYEDLIGSYNLNAARYRLGSSDIDQEMVRKAHRILGSYLVCSLSERVVDKYPELIFRFDFVRAIFPDAKFLFLYRDGVDTCHSIKKWSDRSGVIVDEESHDWWGLNNRKWDFLCEQVVSADPVIGEHVDKIRRYSNHEHMAAVEWIVTMKEGLHLVAEHPDVVLPVKYEDYVESPDYRRRILEFCALAMDEKYNEYCSMVLSRPIAKSKITLPVEIEGEFNRIMGLLGYE